MHTVVSIINFPGDKEPRSVIYYFPVIIKKLFAFCSKAKVRVSSITLISAIFTKIYVLFNNENNLLVMVLKFVYMM